MKGSQNVNGCLNEALFLELGAVNQYWLHYRLLDDWGFSKLAAKSRAESIEEMQHADRLVERIIFLEGHPNLQTLAPLKIGQNIREVLEADLAGEKGHIDFLETQLELFDKIGEERYGALNASPADAAE